MKSIRNINPNKKVIASLIILIIIILLNLALIGVILKINQNTTANNSAKLQSDYVKVLTQNTNLKEIPPRIKNDFEILNSTSKSDEEKYEAVLDLVEAFRSGYSIDRKPEAREFIVKDLNNYTKKSLPELYNPDNFSMACLDPTCGATINNNLQEIIELISNIKLKYETEDKEYTEYNRDVILGNLTNMALVENSNDEFEVLSLGTLVISQLEQDKSNYEEVSIVLKKYMLKRYNFDYEKEKGGFLGEVIQ